MLTCCHSKVLLSLSSSSQTLRVAVLSKTSDECRPAPMQEKGCVDTAVVCYVPHQLFSPSPLLAPPPPDKRAVVTTRREKTKSWRHLPASDPVAVSEGRVREASRRFFRLAFLSADQFREG